LVRFEHILSKVGGKKAGIRDFGLEEAAGIGGFGDGQRIGADKRMVRGRGKSVERRVWSEEIEVKGEEGGMKGEEGVVRWDMVMCSIRVERVFWQGGWREEGMKNG
jgi:hypothetical protein